MLLIKHTETWISLENHWVMVATVHDDLIVSYWGQLCLCTISTQQTLSEIDQYFLPFWRRKLRRNRKFLTAGMCENKECMLSSHIMSQVIINCFRLFQGSVDVLSAHYVKRRPSLLLPTIVTKPVAKALVQRASYKRLVQFLYPPLKLTNQGNWRKQKDFLSR